MDSCYNIRDMFVCTIFLCFSDAGPLRGGHDAAEAHGEFDPRLAGRLLWGVNKVLFKVLNTGTLLCDVPLPGIVSHFGKRAEREPRGRHSR